MRKPTTIEEYRAERTDAIITLQNITGKFGAAIDEAAMCTDFVDTETAALVQAYVPAQMALLHLMKEEIDENAGGGESN